MGELGQLGLERGIFDMQQISGKGQKHCSRRLQQCDEMLFDSFKSKLDAPKTTPRSNVQPGTGIHG
eukprot:5180335-Karenia_brevis.AAC.1